MRKEAIIIFQKNPEKGRVKTRLAADIGEDQALEVYLKLCETCYKTCNSYPADKFLFFDSYLPSENIPGTEGFHYQIQEIGNLGNKMNEAIQRILAKGYEKVVLIGTDCPELTSEHLKQAFEYLESHELVLGPALDGGYYLIGMKRPRPELFKGIPWSTNEVLEKTIKKCTSIGLSYKSLTELSDLDTLDDWNRLKHLIVSIPG
ncbi:TIGR04282 family arsenosugar biosynthesis glycosyltransferase [Algoriphagus limi]|uniref:TIGR04282 family arsenosugar biosynthesis glycosyltransferase n=1 Tax=Algoriphagus limi TaxID=2975273 RepID=A0ABT2G2M6_9BACT|nr:TIGR04282 family arsenosugar biosynthesis glycosyltransferase [Algoriphagus limi]MCS5489530.1 TIGR04282 family arsenosugar biosynthesis glycosyltransferase [Algoriphagus limi]